MRFWHVAIPAIQVVSYEKNLNASAVILNDNSQPKR